MKVGLENLPADLQQEPQILLSKKGGNQEQ